LHVGLLRCRKIVDCRLLEDGAQSAIAEQMLPCDQRSTAAPQWLAQQAAAAVAMAAANAAAAGCLYTGKTHFTTAINHGLPRYTLVLW